MSKSLNIVLVSDTRERLQMASMLASVGAVSGHDVAVFVSMNAMKFFVVGDSAAEPRSEGDFGTLMVERNVPNFMDLFAQSVELGDAKIYPCSMAMDVLQLEPSDMLEFVEPPLGLTKFLEDAQTGQLLTF